jgi:hypothetical protein
MSRLPQLLRNIQGANPAALALLLCLSGCGPALGAPPEDAAPRYGAAICDALASCDCYFPYASASDCTNDYSERMSDLLEKELDFDEECFEDSLAGKTLDSCALGSEVPFAEDCDLLRGSKQRGEECADHFGEVPPFGVDECDGALVCRGGYCRGPEDVLPRLDVGDSCDATEFAQLCNSDPNNVLYCAPDGLCQLQVALGASCDSVAACDLLAIPDLYCQGIGVAGQGICAAEIPLGGACEPADPGSCAFDTESSSTGWCSASERICVRDGPRACGFPLQR